MKPAVDLFLQRCSTKSVPHLLVAAKSAGAQHTIFAFCGTTQSHKVIPSLVEQNFYPLGPMSKDSQSSFEQQQIDVDSLDAISRIKDQDSCKDKGGTWDPPRQANEEKNIHVVGGGSRLPPFLKPKKKADMFQKGTVRTYLGDG